MNTTTLNISTLADSVWPTTEKTASQRFVRSLFLAFVGSLVIAVSSKLQVPFYPVPMTMQTYVILIIGMSFGPRLGMATVLLYLGEGAVGLPVFAGTPEKGIGLAYMLGGTGGYLVGYILAVGLGGWMAMQGWDRNVFKTAAALFAANVAIYIPGLLWLGTLYGWDKPILEWGLYPFVLGDLTKLVLASVTLPLIWQGLNRRR